MISDVPTAPLLKRTLLLTAANYIAYAGTQAYSIVAHNLDKAFTPAINYLGPWYSSVVLFVSTNIIPVALSYTYSYEKGKENTVYAKVCHAMYKQTSSLEELWKNNAPKMAVEYLAHDYLAHFHDNPTTGNFIRDTLKLPGLLWSVATGTQIGKTGTTYSGLNVASQLSKSVIKLAIIGWAIKESLKISDDKARKLFVENWARIANYAGELPSQYLTTMNTKRQEEKREDTPALEFLWENLTPGMITETIASSILKTGVSDVLGMAIKKAGVTHNFKLKITQFETDLFGFDVDFNKDKHHPSIFTKVAHTTSGVIGGVGLVAVDTTAKIVSDFYIAAVSSWPARMAQSILKPEYKPANSTNICVVNAIESTNEENAIPALSLPPVETAGENITSSEL